MIKKIFILALLIVLIYAGGRLYYATTAGFSVSHITSDYTVNPKWAMNPLSEDKKQRVIQALDNKFSYLGKGCQSYVFVSADGQYVLKFFKYQRFRPQQWINLFDFIPSVKTYQVNKKIEKQQNLDKLFNSCKIAYQDLQNESGILYVQLNKSDDLNKSIVIVDKIGMRHLLDLNQMEFILQKKATMWCTAIDELCATGQIDRAKGLIDNLLSMLLFEYHRGFADNDHALMQNTGVIEGRPIHIDTGQFIYNESMKRPKIYKQELFDKMYQMSLWLNTTHKELADHLKLRLIIIIGPDYYYAAPYFHRGNVAKMPHQSPIRDGCIQEASHPLF